MPEVDCRNLSATQRCREVKKMRWPWRLEVSTEKYAGRQINARPDFQDRSTARLPWSQRVNEIAVSFCEIGTCDAFAVHLHVEHDQT